MQTLVAHKWKIANKRVRRTNNMEYRGYRILKRQAGYAAVPIDGDRLEIKSLVLSRIYDAIDRLWDALDLSPRLRAHAELLPYPRWLRDWLKEPADLINLDASYRRGAC